MRFLRCFAGCMTIESGFKQGDESIDGVSRARTGGFQNKLCPVASIQCHQVENVLRVDGLRSLTDSYVALKRRSALRNQRARDQVQSVLARYSHRFCDSVCHCEVIDSEGATRTVAD